MAFRWTKPICGALFLACLPGGECGQAKPAVPPKSSLTTSPPPSQSDELYAELQRGFSNLGTLWARQPTNPIATPRSILEFKSKGTALGQFLDRAVKKARAAVKELSRKDIKADELKRAVVQAAAALKNLTFANNFVEVTIFYLNYHYTDADSKVLNLATVSAQVERLARTQFSQKLMDEVVETFHTLGKIECLDHPIGSQKLSDWEKAVAPEVVSSTFVSDCAGSVTFASPLLLASRNDIVELSEADLLGRARAFFEFLAFEVVMTSYYGDLIDGLEARKKFAFSTELPSVAAKSLTVLPKMDRAFKQQLLGLEKNSDGSNVPAYFFDETVTKLQLLPRWGGFSTTTWDAFAKDYKAAEKAFRDLTETTKTEGKDTAEQELAYANARVTFGEAADKAAASWPKFSEDLYSYVEDQLFSVGALHIRDGNDDLASYVDDLPKPDKEEV